MIRALLVAAAVALLAVPAAGAKQSDTPGVTATQILLGATGPLTGAESQYQPVLSGAQAYFSYVNDHGGVLGRKIVYKVEDDQYDPAQTVTLTQKLVVYLSSTSLAQDPGDALYLAAVQPGAQITIGRATLHLSVLTKAVSK